MFEDNSTDSELLVTLIFGHVSDDLIRKYVELDHILQIGGMEQHILGLEIIERDLLADEIDSMGIPGIVDELLRLTAKAAINDCGVYYNEDISIDDLIELAHAVLMFDPGEDPQRVLDIMDLEDDRVDAFCAVLEHLYDIEFGVWMTIIEELGEGLMERIRDVCRSAIDTAYDGSLPDSTEQVEYITRMQRMAAADPDLTVTDEVVSMEAMYLSSMSGLLDSPMEDVVRNLYRCAAHSSPTFEALQVNVGFLLEDFYAVETFEEQIAATKYAKSIAHEYETHYGD